MCGLIHATAAVAPNLQGLQERLARLREERGVVAGELGVVLTLWWYAMAAQARQDLCS